MYWKPREVSVSARFTTEHTQRYINGQTYISSKCKELHEVFLVVENSYT